MADHPIDRRNRMEFARWQVRDALRQCDELIERTERMIRESGQDNQPRNR